MINREEYNVDKYKKGKFSELKINQKFKEISSEKIKKIAVSILLMVIGFIMIFPIYMIFTNSFKTLREFMASPLALPTQINLDNYRFVFSELKYFRLLSNNIIILTGSLIMIVIFGAMAGFVIARRPSKLKRFIYIFFVLGITLPTFTMLIPQVKLIGQLGLNNNYLGLMLLYAAGGMPMSLFLFTGFFGSVPQELEDATKIDGCSMHRTFFSIFLPISIATISTLVLLQAIGIWNDTTMPVLIMSDEKLRPLMPSLQYFYGRMLGQGTRWERIYAFATVSMAPMIIVFFSVNKYLIKGIAEGALKS